MERTGAERPHSIIRVRPQSVVATLAASAFVALLFIGNGPPERPKPPSSDSANPSSAPSLTSAAELRSLSASARQPVFWVGGQPGTKLELTRTTTGRIFIRYLPAGAQIADPSLAYPFVATYRYPKAFEAVTKASRGSGAVVRRLPNGGLAVQNRRGPELVKATARPLPSPPVFLAYPGSDYLVEVYDRSTDRALGLVSSRRVRPVR